MEPVGDEVGGGSDVGERLPLNLVDCEALSGSRLGQ